MNSRAALRREPGAGRLPLAERIAITLLDRALRHLDGGTLDVTLPDGSNRQFGHGPVADIQIHSDTLFRRLATRGKVGFGESYTAGEWDTSDLTALFELLLRNAEAANRRHGTIRRILDARPRRNRRNGLLRARHNIAYHYDLGNDLFERMLDETMTYSCAIFESPDEPLADAQRRKYRRICDQLDLSPDDHVLEIGCGWGGFALLAATEYGCRVTGLTLSAEQAKFARARIAHAGLTDRIRVVEEDYRIHQGSYTRIASIEMLEAIGEKQFPTYFAAIDRLLVPGGRACVQTILVPDNRYDRYRKAPDWIEQYIFPGCLIPSLSALAHASKKASALLLSEVHEIGPHYAETLKRWRESFDANIEEIRELGYDERFVRTWHFYLTFCEAAFRTRALRDVQLTLRRPFE